MDPPSDEGRSVFPAKGWTMAPWPETPWETPWTPEGFWWILTYSKKLGAVVKCCYFCGANLRTQSVAIDVRIRPLNWKKSCEHLGAAKSQSEFLQASLQYLDLSLDPQATKGVVGKVPRHGYPPDLYNVGKMVYIWMPYTICTFENGGKNPYMDHVP